MDCCSSISPTILFIVTTSFLPRSNLVQILDIVFGFAILADFPRFVLCAHRLREFLRPSTYADIVAIISFLAPLGREAAGFLRILRTLRLLHTYEVLARLRADSSFFRRNEDAIIAATNLAVFIFVMTGIVYETQHSHNPRIKNYVDALYFTITALTTTGFGDITLPGTLGRIISVVIMVCGVTLFLNLARTLFPPAQGALSLPLVWPAAP